MDNFKGRIIDSDSMGRQGTAIISGLDEFERNLDSAGLQTSHLKNNLIGVNDELTKIHQQQKLFQEMETKLSSVGAVGGIVKKAPALWTQAKITEQLGTIPITKLGSSAKDASFKMRSLYENTKKAADAQIYLQKAYHASTKGADDFAKTMIKSSEISKAGSVQYVSELQKLFENTLKRAPTLVQKQLLLAAPKEIRPTLWQELTKTLTIIGTKMPTKEAIANGLITTIRSVPIIGQQIAGKGIASTEVQKRLAMESAGRFGTLGGAGGAGAAKSALSAGSILKGVGSIATKGLLYSSLALGIGAMTTATGRMKVSSEFKSTMNAMNIKFFDGFLEGMILTGMEDIISTPSFMAFLGEDLYQPLTMQIAQARKSGDIKGAEEATGALRSHVEGMFGGAKTLYEFQMKIAEKMGLKEGTPEVMEMGEKLWGAWTTMQPVLERGLDIQDQQNAAMRKKIDLENAFAASLGMTTEELTNQIILNERTLNALELKQKGINIQTSIYNKLLKNAEATMGAITQARFVGEIGAERGIFAGQMTSMGLQEEMMRGYGATSTFGKARSAQGLLQTKGSFQSMAIQRRLLDHAKGTVMHETEAKALMELNKTQQKQALDFQLTHKDEIIAFEEKRIKLDEANASVQLLQLQYELSFGRMRKEIQLNVREIEDKYLKANGLLFDGTTNVNTAIDTATVSYTLAREQAVLYTNALGHLEGQTITLYTAMVKTIDKIMELRGYNEYVDSATGGGSGGGSSSGGGGSTGGSGGKKWSDWSNSELFDALRGGGSGAYGAAAELSKRGFSPDPGTPYESYFHSGGFITSDRVISVQKGERVISKEHASGGGVTLIVNNSFTSVSISDQESIGETISDSILNKLREAKGIV